MEQNNKLFEIEISNPFFSGPSTLNLFDPTAQTKATGGKGKEGSKGNLPSSQNAA